MEKKPSLPRRARNRVERIIAAYRQEHRMSYYNLGYRMIGSLDGYPIPPAELIDLVIGTKEFAWYQLGGMFFHQAMTNILHRNGTEIYAMRSILEFGCGSGRVIRWLAALALKNNTEIWGVDYNPRLIEWCQQNLADMGHFMVNQAAPPLDFPDHKFDFVYAYSVLTHLSAETQRPWLAELARVTKPGGYLLVTVHGKRVLLRDNFPPEFEQRMEAEGFIVHGEDQSGTNYCSVYHSERYMRAQEHNGLKLLEFLPAGTRDSSEQDVYLYQKQPAQTGPGSGP